jgi:oligopeptide/dipeptide ABC transporter ATP-binding protein
MTTSVPLLQVSDMSVDYSQGRRAEPFRALDAVSFAVAEGETLGLVGESGSGKSTVAKALLGLAPVSSGRIEFSGRDITTLRARDRAQLSSDIQIVFQDPYSSFNPSRTLGASLYEMLRPQGVPKKTASARARSLLDQVGIANSALERYPSEFSGGQRQRMAIARALMARPRLLICDESVSALDLSVQAQVINLLHEIQQETGIALLFISHDLSIVRHVSNRLIVLYKGKVLEQGDAKKVYDRPANPYTRLLLDSAPIPDPVAQLKRREERDALTASRANPGTRAIGGCPFTARCPWASQVCVESMPLLEEVSSDHDVACHHWSGSVRLALDADPTPPAHAGCSSNSP